jgi:hypothetical protein
MEKIFLIYLMLKHGLSTALMRSKLNFPSEVSLGTRQEILQCLCLRKMVAEKKTQAQITINNPNNL